MRLWECGSWRLEETWRAVFKGRLLETFFMLFCVYVTSLRFVIWHETHVKPYQHLEKFMMQKKKIHET